MLKFQVKCSVLSPKAKCNAHPLYNETELVFSCENCSIEKAIEMIEKREDYQSFLKRNIILNEKDIYIYYTDEQGNWQHYRSIN